MKCSTCNMLFTADQVCCCDPSWDIAGGDKRLLRQSIMNTHVGVSDMSIAREWLGKCQDKGYPKKVRFRLVRLALEYHAESRDLYHTVMTGKF